MPQHPLEPARVGEPPACDPDDFLLEGARNGGLRLARVEMIEGGRRAKRFRGRSEATRIVGDAIAIENVALAVVLDMHQSVGFRDARFELALCRNAVASAVIGMRGSGEISAANVFARGPVLIERLRRSSRAVNAGRAAENALQAFPATLGFRKRVPVRLFVERAHEPHGRSKKQHLALENIPEKTGNSERDVDPRAVEFREREDFDACDAVCRHVPDRTRAEIGKRLGEIVSAGSKRRGSP